MVRVQVRMTEVEARGLRVRALRAGISMSALVRRAVEHAAEAEGACPDEQAVSPDGRASARGDTPRKPYWERIQDLAAEVPAEEWTRIPADASLNLDHYLYGAPQQ